MLSKPQPSLKNFTLQQDQRDCGVACLLSIIKFYGGNNNLEALRKLSGTNITGTTMLGLYQAAINSGFDAEGCGSNITSLQNHGSPVILHVIKEGNLQHYVVCYGITEIRNETKFIIGDPAVGLVHLSTTELEAIWVSKVCLTLTPNNFFTTSKQKSSRKRKWILELINEDKPILGISIVIGIVIAALGLIMAIFSQRLIDEIIPKRNFTKLYLGIVLVLILLFIKEGLNYLRQLLLIRQAKGFNLRVVDFFYSHLLQLGKPFFDTRKVGELTARLNDTSRIQKVINQIAGSVVIDALITLVTLGFLFFYSWKVALVSLAVLPLFFYLIYRNNKNIIKGQQNIMSSYAVSEANFISTLQGIEPIKNHNKQLLFSQKNKMVYQQFQQHIYLFGNIQMRLSFLANTIGILFLLSVLLYSTLQVFNNHIKIGELMAILSMCGSLLPSVANLALVAIPINEASIAFDRMFEFTGIIPENTEKGINLTYFKSLHTNNLSFRFPGRKQLFQNVSFSLKKGEIIAIMGENGCGKSTITQILQQQYQHENGNITVNENVPLSDVSLENWRQITALVPQNIHIFNGTVLENIAFEDAASKPQQVAQFLTALGFAPFLDRLPQSVMTIVGEEGINLSGGQKQMIALARALYHRPQLLILDEATAAMDRETEQFVLNLLRKLSPQMGIVFITHRLHVLKSFCDRIYILENGTITAQGNHDILLQTTNLYSKYWGDLVS
jgi:ATP-binding cassette, subfamily C, bacteriocin exporter